MTIKSRQNYGAVLRAIVWGVVFVFTLTSVTWTMPTAHANTATYVHPEPVAPLKDLANVSLPAEIGKIRETYRGTSDKTVILIQDAHSIPDAQRSIQSAIDHFQKEYGVTLVGLEGASERLDPQIFRSFPDKELLRKTFDDYSEKGELTGGTAAALFSAGGGSASGGNATIFQGVEDWELYEKGIGSFLEAMKTESDVTASLEQRIVNLDREKETIYPKDLLEVDRLLTQFGENKTDLAKVLTQLSRYLPLPEDSELVVLLKEIQADQRSATENNGLQGEIKKIADQVELVLKSRSSSPELKQNLQTFYGKRQEYQTSQMTPQAFALFLRDLAKQRKVKVKVSRELASLVEDQKKLRNIEGTRLFEDFQRYADAVKEKLIGKSEPAVQDLIKQLNIRTQELALLKRLAKLELSFEDWTILKKTMAKPWTLDPELRTQLEFHLRFYRIAEQRDEVFYNHLTDLIKKNEFQGTSPEPRTKNAAILVAGGFHTGGLTHAFKEKGISYILVMPRIDRLPEQSLYREHMQGDVSWKNYFEVKNGKVNLYDAFVRATRDKLLNTKSLTNPESRVLSPLRKQWRDQIIRDLAEQGRISEASAYTRFMDELGGQGATHDARRLKEAWIANIDRFGDGLKKLQAAGKLSASGIAQLIKAMTTAEPVLANVLVPGAEIKWPLSVQHAEKRKEDKTPAAKSTDAFQTPGKIIRSETRVDHLQDPSKRYFLGLCLKTFAAVSVVGLPSIVLAQSFERTIFAAKDWKIIGAADSGPGGRPIQTPYGIFTEIKIVYKGDQIFSVKGNGYLRGVLPTNYRGPNEERVDWGTSFVLPGYWSGGAYHHNPRLTRAKFGALSDGTVVLTGTLEDEKGNLQAGDFKIIFRKPLKESVEAEVSFTLKAKRNFSIDADRIAKHEGLKVLQFSSMNIGAAHDADFAVYQGENEAMVRSPTAGKNRFIIPQSQPLDQGLVYLTNEKPSSWGYRPTVFIQMLPDSTPADFSAQGWISESSNPNDDNLGVWIHYDGAKKTSYQKRETIVRVHAVLGTTRPGLPLVAPSSKSRSEVRGIERMGSDAITRIREIMETRMRLRSGPRADEKTLSPKRKPQQPMDQVSVSSVAWVASHMPEIISRFDLGIDTTAGGLVMNEE